MISPQIKQDCTTDYYLVQGPLSNFYPCKIEQESDNGRSIVFKSAEHCYQYNKVQFLLKTRCDPTISLQDIMQAKTAATEKWLGDKLNNHPDLHDRTCGTNENFKYSTISTISLLYHSVSDKYWAWVLKATKCHIP